MEGHEGFEDPRVVGPGVAVHRIESVVHGRPLAQSDINGFDTVDQHRTTATFPVVRRDAVRSAHPGGVMEQVELRYGIRTDVGRVREVNEDAFLASPPVFVVAAGNNGPVRGGISYPGAAASALTVGAVDGSDMRAPFSSRGPLLNTRAAKPELVEGGWRTFLVKVRNQAGATGSLRVTSPNARQVPNGPASADRSFDDAKPQAPPASTRRAASPPSGSGASASQGSITGSMARISVARRDSPEPPGPSPKADPEELEVSPWPGPLAAVEGRHPGPPGQQVLDDPHADEPAAADNHDLHI